ncbi:hypothetical protein BDV26DRAFT_73299 [Aspergillus bertholletiae]|uniref:Uncharacterized protein n=1 Tax=Aspergillus bertholletiae TaxID=1226010 RepID=A0A5N7ATM7_9EURO|nr:hypothetical protein BDV26DRAFT_73299 [Aspergillus bertholletiae]
MGWNGVTMAPLSSFFFCLSCISWFNLQNIEVQSGYGLVGFVLRISRARYLLGSDR